MYDKAEEVGKRRIDKSQIICRKRAINYDVLNCRSLGQANYKGEVEAGSPAPRALETGETGGCLIVTATTQSHQIRSCLP